MTNKQRLFKAKYSMLFWDCLMWLCGQDKWSDLRKESNTFYKLLKIMYKP